MDEKAMVNDILAGVKADLTAYQTAISECENTNLRQCLQQIRNNDESFHFELFKIAQTKGYYVPAQKVSPSEVNTVKTQIGKWKYKKHMQNVNQKRDFAKNVKSRFSLFP